MHARAGKDHQRYSSDSSNTAWAMERCGFDHAVSAADSIDQ